MDAFGVMREPREVGGTALGQSASAFPKLSALAREEPVHQRLDNGIAEAVYRAASDAACLLVFRCMLRNQSEDGKTNAYFV
jgi:hypothetical protein